MSSIISTSGVLLGAALLMSRPRGGVRAAAGPTVGSVTAEWVATIVLFAVVMPFERLFMGAEPRLAATPGRRPVLLVPGYMCNRGLWFWFRARLRAMGWSVATVTLETPWSDIERLADGLERRIDEVLAETGAEQLSLVTHSMGGLIARAALRRPGVAGRVARFVTLAGPHHGSSLAALGLGANARQMRPGSAWLAELDRTPLTVPTLSIWSAGDQLVAPQASSRLDGAAEIVLPAMAHMTMVLSPTVVELVGADLARDRGAPRDAGRA